MTNWHSILMRGGKQLLQSTPPVGIGGVQEQSRRLAGKRYERSFLLRAGLPTVPATRPG